MSTFAELMQLSQTQSKGKHSLQNLQTMLAVVSEYTLDAFPSSDDFEFVPKYRGHLGPFMALCVGHTSNRSSQKGVPLYIMDISDGKESPPDLHCHTDTFISWRIPDLDLYVLNHGIFPKGCWAGLLRLEDSWKIGYGTDRFQAVFQYAQMMCGHREMFVGKPRDLFRALENIARSSRIQAAKAEADRESKSTEEEPNVLSRTTESLRADPRQQISVAISVKDDATSAQPEIFPSTATAQKTFEWDEGESTGAIKSRVDSLQVGMPPVCFCVYDVDEGYTCGHKKSG